MDDELEEYDLDRTDQYVKLKDPKQNFHFYFPNSLFKLLGEVGNKKILDIGCGDGFYCRFLKQKGASKVLGIDLSRHMINKAIKLEEQNPLGCQFKVGNATEDSVEDEFDFVIAIFVLVYAENEETLAKFCNYMIKNLKPGGCCVAFIRNCLFRNFWNDSMEKYGYNFSKLGSTQDGGISLKTTLDGFNVTNFCLRPETYEKCFRQAGFSTFEFRQIELTEESWYEDKPIGFWDEYNKNPHQIAIVATKSICKNVDE